MATSASQDHRVGLFEEGEPSAAGKREKVKRVASLDIFRGLTVAVMILVDDAGYKWQSIGHAPWNGCNLADLVMPFFLFIVGVAIALSLKRIPDQFGAVKKVVLRTLKMLLWGIILQGGYIHGTDELSYGVDMTKIRWSGILQRIAVAYLIVAILEIVTRNLGSPHSSNVYVSMFKSYFWQWLVGACMLLVYMATLYGLYVPDWEFTVQDVTSRDFRKRLTVQCGVRGKLDPPCNAVGYVDRRVLGLNHMYHHPNWRRSKDCTASSPYEGPFRSNAPAWCEAPFEPEGILRSWAIVSSISAILTTIFGVHCGHVLIHIKDHSERLKNWVSAGLLLLLLGLVLHFTDAIPLNKQLYSLSYVCLTAGAAAITFSVFYILVDVWDLRLLFRPLEWIGMNAMLVFVLAAAGISEAFINGWYYGDTNKTLVNWIKKHVFIKVWHSEKVGVLLYVIFAEIGFWAIVCGILHRLGMYWKL